ncbi:MAG: MBL fold metallo-hydrolase [Deltaproteobacteria bacterium]|nr:MAG: MBL fold metallo-hydrolase [Deltaproteobacteria bacterium]
MWDRRDEHGFSQGVGRAVHGGGGVWRRAQTCNVTIGASDAPAGAPRRGDTGSPPRPGGLRQCEAARRLLQSRSGAVGGRDAARRQAHPGRRRRVGIAARLRRARARCKEWHERVMDGLARDLRDAPLDLLWITHPHSDHIGGAVDLLNRFTVNTYAFVYTYMANFAAAR